jgi:hypothetical protein
MHTYLFMAVPYLYDKMISAVITSLDNANLLATPNGNVDPATLVGRRARYVDKNGKIWPCVIKGADDPFVIVQFDVFPSGLGQGQLLDIMEDGDDINSL